MKEIVTRLKENRDIERAKSIMESAGYKLSKRLKESLSSGEKKAILDIFNRNARVWDNEEPPKDSYDAGKDFVVVMGNSNPTYISSLMDDLRGLEDKYDIGFEMEDNDDGFYGKNYIFYKYSDYEDVDESRRVRGKRLK